MSHSERPPLSDGPRLAHSANPLGAPHPLKDHLSQVALRASRFAEPLGMAQEAFAAGLLHDLGKYGDLFQKRLRGEADRIDHWTAGAWEALLKYRWEGIAAALAIQGHHIGLVTGNRDRFRVQMNPDRLVHEHPLNLTLSDGDVDALMNMLKADGIELPESFDSTYDAERPDKAAAMLDVRMLYSALVDADFLDTERHFAEGLPPEQQPLRDSPELQPERAFDLLQAHIDTLKQAANASPDVATLRNDLYQACLDAADRPTGLYTLSAPTGSGKTLAMLAFALRHAIHHGLRRIVCVIPFLSIIEQTADEYRHLFEDTLGPNYVLEHHSLSGTRGAAARGDDSDQQSPAERTARLISQNWDAPLVVTTSVQCLESLMAHRPSACRKLHRLARSVILFDEVQTLPPQLAESSLATLSHLAHRYDSTVVFSTATQPAFTALNEGVKRLCVSGWSPEEIVPPKTKLFSRVCRTKVQWPKRDDTLSWGALAGRIVDRPQALCIVNLRRHARELFTLLGKDGGAADGVFHLSTSMCPAHRTAVLDEVRRRLEANEPCRLISTQCVEAGVDLDFPAVFRAFGPLEAVAQAAGRCNRRGTMPRPGEVIVFRPEPEERGGVYPPGGYEQAAGVTDNLLTRNGGDLKIDNPATFDAYYRELYTIGGTAEADQGKARRLKEAIMGLDFEEVAHEYRLIKQDAINIVVPYEGAAYDSLVEEANETGLTAKWLARARPHTVSLFRPKADNPVHQVLDPVRLRGGGAAEDWFVCFGRKNYKADIGFVEPEEWETIVCSG